MYAKFFEQQISDAVKVKCKYFEEFYFFPQAANVQLISCRGSMCDYKVEMVRFPLFLLFVTLCFIISSG